MRRRTIAVGGAAFFALAVVMVAGQVFPTAGPRAASTPVVLPQGLEHLVFMACLPGLVPAAGDSGPDAGPVTVEQGLTFSTDGSRGALSVRIEAVGDWSVTVSHAGAILLNERPSGDQAQILSIADNAIPAARSLYKCMAPYRFDDRAAEPPSSSAQMLQLYRYDREVLWPCLKSQGIDVGDPPSRSQFVDSASTLAANPLSAVTVTSKTLPRLAAALHACPLRPAYLG